jgi:hypothetical protein
MPFRIKQMGAMQRLLIRTLILCTILMLLSFYLAVQSLSACDGPTPLHYNDDGQAALCKWSGTVRYADNN